MAETIDSAIKNIKHKQYHPVYFLHGETPYYIDLVADLIENVVLDEGQKSFNQTIFYGKDTDVQTILDTAKRYPMMSDYQVVIVKEAQGIKNIERLLPYIKNPLKSTILVICYKYKKLDKRTAFAKALTKKSIVLDSKKLYDNQIPPWIEKHARHLHLSIKPNIAALIAEHIGNDLSRIANELKKLSIILPKGSEITAETVERNIGISKEYNVFELQNAIGRKDYLNANLIIKYFNANPKSGPMMVVLATLYTFFSKLYIHHSSKKSSDRELASLLSVNPFFIKDYKIAAANFAKPNVENVLKILYDYDLKVKGINSVTSEGALLQEMISKILHS